MTNQIKILSTNPEVFKVTFDGTFTGVLSALLKSELFFYEAWNKAVSVCDDIKDVAAPVASEEIGTYYSRSGKRYHLGTEGQGNKQFYYIVLDKDSLIDPELVIQDLNNRFPYATSFVKILS